MLPSLAGEIQKARLSGAQRRQGPVIRKRPTFVPESFKPTTAFGAFLDSVLLTEVFTLIDVEPDILKPLHGHLILLRDVSRKLRRLTVALSVDPIRTWLYHHIGNEGIFPSQRLHKQHIFWMSSSLVLSYLLYEVTPAFSSVSLRSTVLIPCLDTFSLLELDRRANNYLNQTFYKRHIIDQYNPRLGEWIAIMLAIQLIEVSPNFQSRLLHGVIDMWIWQVLKVVPTDENLVHSLRSNYYLPPSQRFSMLKVRGYTMNPLGPWGILWYMPSLLILYITKLITTVGPSLEKLLVDLVTHVMGWVYLLSCLNILFENWIYSAAFIIYFLRLKYLPGCSQTLGETSSKI